MNEYRTNLMMASGGETRKTLNIVNVVYQDGGIQTYVEVVLTRSRGKNLSKPICEVFSNIRSAQELYDTLK